MPDVAAQPPAITIPPTAYDPTFFQAQLNDFGAMPNDPRAAVNINQMETSMIPQPMDFGAPWGGAFNRSFSMDDEYEDPSLHGEGQWLFNKLECYNSELNPLSRI
jgi:hypothetical protein